MKVDLKAWQAEMKAFATIHARELASEIIEWHDTALLKEGKLRELSKLAAPVATHDALKVAENFAIRAALVFAAAQPTEKGGANDGLR